MLRGEPADEIRTYYTRENIDKLLIKKYLYQIQEINLPARLKGQLYKHNRP